MRNFRRRGFPPGPDVERVDFEDEAVWLDRFLEPGTHLVGHSYGGVISLLLWQAGRISFWAVGVAGVGVLMILSGLMRRGAAGTSAAPQQPSPSGGTLGDILGQIFGREMPGSPGIPADRKAALIKAFDGVMKDPELLAEAEKQRMDIEHMSGREIDELLEQLYATPPHIVAKAASAIAE